MFTPLFISTDGTRSKKKSVDSWIVALEDDICLTFVFNPNYVQNYQIDSYTSSVLSTIRTPPQLTYIIFHEVK